jgi:CBS domain-containing protein
MRPITAADLMNPEVLTVREDLTVEALARFLIANEISGAPVESADGRLVGVVSLRDIVAYATGEDDDDGEEAHSDYYARGWEEDGWSEEDLEELDLGGEELLVEDIMTPRVFSVSEDASVPEIASLMLKEHLHRLLVIRDGRPLGIISTSDLLGLLVEEG